MKSKILAILSIAALCLFLVSCGENSIVGVWEWNQDVVYDGEVLYTIQREIEFTKDNIFLTTENGEIIARGSYSVGEGKIIMHTEQATNSADYPFRWEAGNLILVSEQEEILLTKK
ncbi:MAG: hypothetical protein FWG87_06850 [Defluviitaleaceae bacterium]|nr:hypothetical protein [Defluviitaleaceae bacterium]